MRQFFKFTLASCLGVFVAMGLLFLFFLLIIVAASTETHTPVRDGSVLKIALQITPPEHTNNVPTDPFRFSQNDIIGVQEIIERIRHAGTDERIKGIYLDPTFIMLGPANASEVLEELRTFRDNDKFVVSYGNYYNQLGYYLASACDHIILNPIGSVDFRGFAAFVPFYKELLDMTGMKMQIYYAGDFKSATEPFRRQDMSPQNKLQTREYLDDAYDQFLSDIAEARGIRKERLIEIANELLSKNADDALALGLIDQVGHDDALDKWLRDQLELDEDEEPQMINISDYESDAGSGRSSNRIAVVFCEGAIVNGEGDFGQIGGERYVELFQDLRDNDRIDAVVLRVNSPGGNILAAENILQEIKLLKETGKPVVVSMSDYAASGGYYISAFADSIYAEANTLTGSIGVFTIIPNPHALLEDKLGISFDTVRTGDFSASFSPFFEWSDAEHAYLQSRTDQYYELFLRQVSEGRDMSRDEVHEIAQGRIWSGIRAKELGLVDEIGDLESAIDCAARLADIEEWRVTAYPRIPDQVTRIINELSSEGGSVLANTVMERKLGEVAPEFRSVSEILSFDEPIARLPVILRFK